MTERRVICVFAILLGSILTLFAGSFILGNSRGFGLVLFWLCITLAFLSLGVLMFVAFKSEGSSSYEALGRLFVAIVVFVTLASTLIFARDFFI
jgi:hypothetical protein